MGITPAYAGKSLGCWRPRAAQRDHPRVCGEKYALPLKSARVIGSPPRMRGKAAGVFVLCPVCRITPAYAGKSLKADIKVGVKRDHPRVCGEKRPSTSAVGTFPGSPPRMRGKVLKQLIVDSVDGITPAYAGKSVFVVQFFQTNQDHPRVCGEKPKFELDKLNSVGSPPRMRGKDLVLRSKHLEIGITPACVGKSVRRENSSS